MSSLTGGLSPDLGPGPGVKRPLEDAGDSGPRTEAGSKKYKQDLANLPTRQYLDQTVVPILLQVTRRRHQDNLSILVPVVIHVYIIYLF